MRAQAIHRGEAGYPRRLGAGGVAPSPLWLRGSWSPAPTAVALVGSRAASYDGVARAEALGAALARAGIDVISGGALGIDAAAHRGALAVADEPGAGRTVAVLGTGADVVYPERHAALFEAIVASGGALLTQFPLGMTVRRAAFPARNRLLAALADVVVVVEAGHASGTRYTVAAMRALGRPVAAVPGSAGTDRLLGAGALPVTSAADVQAILAGGVPPARPPAPVTFEDAGAARLYAVLDEVPRDVGELADRAGLAVTSAAALVVELELGGLAARAAGGRYLRLR